MDHMKGGRWALGSSSVEDLVAPRHEPYWTRLAPAEEDHTPAGVEQAPRVLVDQ